MTTNTNVRPDDTPLPPLYTNAATPGRAVRTGVERRQQCSRDGGHVSQRRLGVLQQRVERCLRRREHRRCRLAWCCACIGAQCPVAETRSALHTDSTMDQVKDLVASMQSGYDPLHLHPFASLTAEPSPSPRVSVTDERLGRLQGGPHRRGVCGHV